MKRAARFFLIGIGVLAARGAFADEAEFPDGTATPAETCGACHQAIYNEFAHGFGADLEYGEMVLGSKSDRRLKLPAGASTGATAHAVAGADPWPMHAREAEAEGKSCDVCHFPQAFALPDIDAPEAAKPKPRPKEREASGLTCASCHLTPEGRIRGPYAAKGPHVAVEEPKMRTSAACAYCHAMGRRVIGKQTQTFLEWREDYFKPGLGRQHCQDCHMPRTIRKLAEGFDVPERAVGRHLWTGGHSAQRLQSALSLVAAQPDAKRASFQFHVINVGAGHSVPTGSNRRAVYLAVELANAAGERVASTEWMFAPWFGNRPDDRKHLEEDKTGPDSIATMQADAQGPHEAPIRAGEERVLTWSPELSPGAYTIRARLIYDLNRYNDRGFADDQTEINKAVLKVGVGG